MATQLKQPTTALLLLSTLSGLNLAYADTESGSALDTIVVTGQAENKDQKGQDDVYFKTQVTGYKGKKELDTYKVQTVSDLLTGITGVYSGDARNGGALDPNIRGVQGQGRIPVLVDDTEQAITVWRGFAGVSNRNYLDPYLVSSVAVEKGPSLDRTLRTGAAGTVKMTTLEVDDIVKEGETFGIEFKGETGTNSIKNRSHPFTIGQDYRGMSNPEEMEMGEYAVFYRTKDRYTPRSHGRNKPFKDNAYRLAIATKQDKYEGLIAYAEREKGNYYAGRKGADKYHAGENIADIANGNAQNLHSEDPYVPWIAAIYAPSNEVPNTSYYSKSWLLKNQLNFTEHSHLKMGLRHSEIEYGDIMPSRTWITEYQLGTVLEWPLANVKQTAANMEYSYNPDNPWIDLKIGAWAVWNKTKTNTSGGSPGDILFTDKNFWAITREFDYRDPDYFSNVARRWQEYYNSSDKTPNTDGLFNTQEAQAQYSKDKHWGLNFSNRFKLHDKVSLDIMANYRRETLDSDNIYSLWDKYRVLAGTTDTCTEMNPNICRIGNSAVSSGRYGKRNEFNAGFNFEFYPTNWLILNAGAKYTHYKSVDKGLQRRVAGKNYDELSYDSLIWSRIPFKYSQLITLTEQEQTLIDSYNKKYNQNIYDYNNLSKLYGDSAMDPEPTYPDLEALDWDIDLYDAAYDKYSAWESRFNQWKTDNNYTTPNPMRGITEEEIQAHAKLSDNDGYEDVIAYWERDEYGNFNLVNAPVNDGRLTKEMLEEEGTNIITGEQSKKIKLQQSAIDPNLYIIDPEDENLGKVKPTPEQWKEMLKAERKDHAWAPAFGATIFVTDNIRLYARYNETKRMPSIFEDTLGYSTSALSPLYKRKPEHSKNFEIGYIHDLTGFFPNLRRADIRFNYFHNTTRNIFDRNKYYEMQQFDKRVLSGLELQARYDQGNFFADLGVSYQLKNKFCDKSSALFDYKSNLWFNKENWAFKQLPECVNAGNANGYLQNTGLPKYSITSNLGVRLLNEKLELGTRMLYHTRVKHTRARSLRNAGFAGNDNVYRWQPVFVIDAYANYKLNDNLAIDLAATNLTDRYYLDPLSRSALPAPGRTIKLGLTATF